MNSNNLFKRFLIIETNHKVIIKILDNLIEIIRNEYFRKLIFKFSNTKIFKERIFNYYYVKAFS